MQLSWGGDCGLAKGDRVRVIYWMCVSVGIDVCGCSFCEPVAEGEVETHFVYVVSWEMCDLGVAGCGLWVGFEGMAMVMGGVLLLERLVGVLFNLDLQD